MVTNVLNIFFVEEILQVENISLCLSLFQLAQLWAVEQPVWMTRGGILSSDITRCVWGRKSEFSACNSSAITVQNWLQVRKRFGESGVLIFAYLELSGAFLWNCQQGSGHVYIGLVLIWCMLSWLGDLTWAHSVCIVPCQQCHPFPSLPPSSRSGIVPTLQTWPWHHPLAPRSSKFPGWPEKVTKAQMLIGELYSLSTVSP